MGHFVLLHAHQINELGSADVTQMMLQQMLHVTRLMNSLSKNKNCLNEIV